MGCGSSTPNNTVIVHDADEEDSNVILCESLENDDSAKIIACQINKANNNNIPRVLSDPGKQKIIDCNLYDQISGLPCEDGNYDVLIVEDGGAEEGERGWSAHSKDSTDSGFNDEYAHVISESSESDKVQSVLDNFDPNIVIDLTITGLPLRQHESANSRTREEELILKSLQDNGLISRPTAQAPGGLCFEVVSPNDDNMERKPPSRLAKLVLSKKQEAQDTNEDIDVKQENARSRRKSTVSEKLEKIRSTSRADDQKSPRDNAARVSRHIERKMKKALKNRQQHLNGIRKKLRQHDHHIDIVKQRRMVHVTNADDDLTPRSGSQESPRRWSQDSPRRWSQDSPRYGHGSVESPRRDSRYSSASQDSPRYLSSNHENVRTGSGFSRRNQSHVSSSEINIERRPTECFGIDKMNKGEGASILIPDDDTHIKHAFSFDNSMGDSFDVN